MTRIAPPGHPAAARGPGRTSAAEADPDVRLMLRVQRGTRTAFPELFQRLRAARPAVRPPAGRQRGACRGDHAGRLRADLPVPRCAIGPRASCDLGLHDRDQPLPERAPAARAPAAGRPVGAQARGGRAPGGARAARSGRRSIPSRAPPAASWHGRSRRPSRRCPRSSAPPCSCRASTASRTATSPTRSGPPRARSRRCSSARPTGYATGCAISCSREGGIMIMRCRTARGWITRDLAGELSPRPRPDGSTQHRRGLRRLPARADGLRSARSACWAR